MKYLCYYRLHHQAEKPCAPFYKLLLPKMKQHIFIAIFLMFILGCDNSINQYELKKLFEKTTYDTSVVQIVPLLDSIKNVIVNNIDTIFKFRNNRNIVHYQNKDSVSLIQENSSDYSFSTHKADYDTTHYFPDFIFSKLNSQLEKLHDKGIETFTLVDDGTFEIDLKTLTNTEIPAEIIHRFRWGSPLAFTQDPNRFIKDTSILGWHYEIWVSAILGR